MQKDESFNMRDMWGLIAPQEQGYLNLAIPIYSVELDFTHPD